MVSVNKHDKYFYKQKFIKWKHAIICYHTRPTVFCAHPDNYCAVLTEYEVVKTIDFWYCTKMAVFDASVIGLYAAVALFTIREKVSLDHGK